jgi:hypothetical protein
LVKYYNYPRDHSHTHADLLHLLLLSGSTSPDDPSIGGGPIWRETGLNYTWTASATPDRPLTLVPPGSAEVNGTVVKDRRWVNPVFMLMV